VAACPARLCRASPQKVSVEEAIEEERAKVEAKTPVTVEVSSAPRRRRAPRRGARPSTAQQLGWPGSTPPPLRPLLPG
jgi:hypothetical protein